MRHVIFVYKIRNVHGKNGKKSLKVIPNNTIPQAKILVEKRKLEEENKTRGVLISVRHH